MIVVLIGSNMKFELLGRDGAEASPTLCPECGEPTVNVQGLADCAGCQWSGQ